MDWSGRGWAGSNQEGPFLYRKHKRYLKESNVSSNCIIIIEHDIKQNIYTVMEVIPLIPP